MFPNPMTSGLRSKACDGLPDKNLNLHPELADFRDVVLFPFMTIMANKFTYGVHLHIPHLKVYQHRNTIGNECKEERYYFL